MALNTSLNLKPWIFIGLLYLIAALLVTILDIFLHPEVHGKSLIFTYLEVLISPPLAIVRMIYVPVFLNFFGMVSIFGIPAIFLGWKYHFKWFGEALLFIGIFLEIGVSFLVAGAVI